MKALETQPLDWINKEILYKSMLEVLRGSGPGLDLNYYEVQLAIQLSVWIEQPGFEVLICLERADSSTDILLTGILL